jgi:hypothetical protein
MASMHRCQHFNCAAAAAQRINRKGITAVPSRLTIIVSASERSVTPSFVSKPIGLPSEMPLKRTRTEPKNDVLPLSIFVWPDTTIREIVEEVLRSEEACELLHVTDTVSSCEVKISHVFPGSDRQPRIELVGVMDVNKVVKNGVDGTTIASMQDPKSREFQFGDMLVISRK